MSFYEDRGARVVILRQESMTYTYTAMYFIFCFGLVTSVAASYVALIAVSMASLKLTELCI